MRAPRRTGTIADNDRAEDEKTARKTRAGLRHSMLEAALLMNRPDELAALKEDPVPTEKKELPPFELADLSGKTWKLKQLEGRTLLINLWATWCGPCQSELPKLQKLYDTVKDRADVTDSDLQHR